MAPSTPHEGDNRTLALLVEVVAEEWEIDVRNVGPMTYKRKGLRRGFEPDTSFYIRQEARVRDRTQIDLAVDPPPDLVIEIDGAGPSLPKLPIDVDLGVAEVWRSTRSGVIVHTLAAAGYVVAEASGALSPLTDELPTRCLAESRSYRRTAWL